MMWVYHILDLLITLTESFSLCVPMYYLLKKPRFHKRISLFVTSIIITAFGFWATWASDMGALKILFIFSIAILSISCCYKDSITTIFVVIEIWYAFYMIFPESLMFASGKWLWDGNITTIVNGAEMIKWQIYVLGMVLRFLTIALTYRILRGVYFKFQTTDIIILTADFLIVVVPFVVNIYGVLNLNTQRGLSVDLILAVLGVVFMLHFLYSKNVAYLREQEQKNEVQIAQLQQQYAYYQDKLKDEERVRSIYHDLKNHLLVLEDSQGTEATRQMAQELRSQIADYDNYIQTGNDFLNVIIKDKAEKAREKQIDFSVSVDFSDIDFIEPLDISTLFGNGLDNAIEASEKLPEAQRVVLVKAGKVQNFVSILIENNCMQEVEQKKDRTTKADSFLHGFGISNMKKAAEKYEGTCTTAQKDGKFRLKILLPVPEVRRGDIL